MKTPLCAIALYNDLLRDAAPDSAEREAYHEGIAAQVERLTVLAGVLDDPAPPPDQPLQKEGVSLRPLLEETVLLHTTLHGRRGYEFALEIPNALPYLFASRDALGRVLDNLLDNAVKYSKPHRILLRALEAHRPAGAFLVLEVKDQGPGIPSWQRQHLFEPYYRGRNHGSGRGLGLSIVHRLVKAHKGHIEVDSTPGGGTTFRVLFPVKQITHGASCPIAIKRHVYSQ